MKLIRVNEEIPPCLLTLIIRHRRRQQGMEKQGKNNSEITE